MPLLILLILFVSCGRSDEEQVDDAIESAQIALSAGDCNQAISLLEAVGRQNRNAFYLRTLSAAYACSSGFTETNFYGNNVTRVNSDISSFFGSLTTFNDAPMSGPLDSNYLSLQTAIDILLYAGGLSEPSASDRSEIFPGVEAANMNLQASYMMLTQLAKYNYYYGNADPTNGEKGSGTILNGNSNGNTNTCFMTYTVTDAITLISAGSTGSCTNAANTGHPDLAAVAQASKVTRLCEGVVLFNNFIDTFLNVSLPSQDTESLQTLLSTLATAFETLCSSTTSSSVCSVKSQTRCESDFGTDPGDVNSNTGSNLLELYMAAIYEYMFR